MEDAAVAVLAKVWVVVVGDASPGGLPLLSRLVWVVARGVPHHVEGTGGAILLQRLRQHQGEGPAAEAVRVGGQAARAIVKGHGADALPQRHPFNAPDRGEIHRGTRPNLILKAVLHLFGRTDGLCHKGHGGSSYFCKMSNQEQ